MRGRLVIVTMDRPPAYLDPLGWRCRRPTPGFVGFRPPRVLYPGSMRRSGVQRNLGRWQALLPRPIPERKSRWT